jgi:ubiquinone/menaquinone biosynthesis C-methylase UbiE
MTEDPEGYRARSRELWEGAAEGWGRQAERQERSTLPVSTWMIDALAPQPGQSIVELAGGPGSLGLLIAELVRPGGHVLLTDGAEAMVQIAQRRAQERGLGDVVQTRAMEAEWIDLPAASVDGVISRWGFMLLADPDAALLETRRVLRPGGVVVLAAWADPEANPWMTALARELAERGLVETVADPDAPGPFAWRDRAAIGERLSDAGFTEVVLDTVPMTFEFPDRDAWWDAQIDCSPSLSTTLLRLDPALRDELMEAGQARLTGYVEPDGRLVLPALTHVARAEA